MLKIIRQLARVGAIFIEVKDRKWWVACEVAVSDGTTRNIVKTTGYKLHPTLDKLLSLAKAEKIRLTKRINTPTQETIMKLPNGYYNDKF